MVNEKVTHVIDDVPSVVEYSMALADGTREAPRVPEYSDENAAV